MDELRKASILLKHLSPGEREQILGQIDPEQRVQLEQMVAAATDVSRAELVEIVSEYQSWLQRVSAGPAVGPESAVPFEADEGPATESDRVWQFVSGDGPTIVNKLTEEPAAVLSAVLCLLHESTARAVYESLSEERQAAVAARLPAQRELMPIVEREIAGFLSEADTGAERDNHRGSALLARLVGS